MNKEDKTARIIYICVTAGLVQLVASMATCTVKIRQIATSEFNQCVSVGGSWIPQPGAENKGMCLTNLNVEKTP